MVVSNGQAIAIEQPPPNIEKREGFFDMTFADSADRASPNTNGNDIFRINMDINGDIDSSSSSSTEDGSERDITENTSYSPTELETMPTVLPPMNRTPPIKETPKSRTERIIDSINKRAPGLVIRRILKCSIAYFIATLFSTIHPVARALPPAPFIICSGSLFCHPGRTMGSQFDASITAALGAALAIAYGIGGLEAATAYNTSHPDSHAGAGINCLFLVVGVFSAQLLRQKFPKLHFFSMQFMLVQLFAMTNGVGFKESPNYFSVGYGLAFLLGNIVSLFVNLVLWPETAVDGLGRTLSCTLYNTRQMVDTISRQFFLDPKSSIMPAKEIDDLAGKMRQDMMKVNTAYKEAKYEVSFAYACSADLNPIRGRLNKVTKHLRILGCSLKTERVFFKDTESSLSSDEEDEESNKGRNKMDRGTSDEKHKLSGTPGKIEHHQSRQSSFQHPQDAVNREMSLRRSALKATNSYIKDGTYSRPYDNTSDTNAASQSTSVFSNIPNGIETMFEKQQDDGNDKGIRFKNPGVTNVTKKSSKAHGSQSLASDESVTNPEVEKYDNEVNVVAENRKSFSHSIKSIFSSNSRAHQSDHRSAKEEDEDYTDVNQNPATSLKSFLDSARLLGPKIKPPPRSEKKVDSNDKYLLVAYLEKLRDPLLSLAAECATVLDCVRDSINEQLNLTDDNDANIQYKSFWRYILHTFRIKSIHNENQLNIKKRDASFLCSCAETMRLRIAQFDKCEKDRMSALYKINLCHMGGERLETSLREELFFVLFFIFILREVALELEQMATEVRNLQIKCHAQVQANPKKKKQKHLYMPQVTTQTWKKWLYSNDYQNSRDRGGYTFAHLQQDMPAQDYQRDLEDEYRLTKLANNRNNNNHPHDSKDEGTDLPQEQHSKKKGNLHGDDGIALAELESGPPPLDMPDSMGKLPPLRRLRYKLWLWIKYIQGYEFKFAIKLSVGVAVLTMPAWIPGYAVWFGSVRGQWAALTVIAIMSPTSGGTVATGLWRLAGTLIGAFAAWAVLEINRTSGILLSGFAFVFAIPFFYIQFSTSYSKVSVVALISYMLIALSQYVAPVNYVSVTDLVWLRTASLVIGLGAALFLNWVIWPFVARRAVRKTLACTIGDLGDYYSYVMGTFFYYPERLFPTMDEFKEAEKMERKLGKKLVTCNELLELTDHEPRLKGPFPKEFYKEMLVSAHNLLDRMIALRISLMKMSPGTNKTVRKLDKYLYRRDMVASILLHFYTISASLKAKIPVPSYIPSARNARSRLLKNRRQEDRPEKILRYRNLSWFALASSTEEIIIELEHLTDLVRFIVGESKFSVKARSMEKDGKLHKR